MKPWSPSGRLLAAHTSRDAQNLCSRRCFFRRLSSLAPEPRSPRPLHDCLVWPVPTGRRRTWRYSRRPKYLLHPKPDAARERLLDRQPHESPSEARNLKMMSWVEILSAPTADAGACLLVHFDKRRYLVGNVSEGTQRVLVQRKTSTRSIEDIFLTGPVNWTGVGGLMGMVLTMADAAASARGSAEEENARRVARGLKPKAVGPAALNIHGARNLTHTLATARKFIFRQGFPLRPHEIRSDPRAAGLGEQTASCEPDWQDANLRVWNVPVFPKPRTSRKRSHDALSGDDEAPASSDPTALPLPAEEPDGEAEHQVKTAIVKNMFDSDWKLDALHEVRLRDVQLPATLFVRNDEGHVQKYDGPLPGGRDPAPDIRVLVRSPWPSAMVGHLPATKKHAESMSYIVKNQPRRGKFRADEAARLGLARTDFKRVIAGESAPGKDGSTVTPDMVVEPTVEGHGFAVVDIPLPRYIDGFLARPEWSAPDIMRGIDAMYWITRSPHVVEDVRIVSFMRERPHIRHVVLAPGIGSNHLSFGGAAAEAVKLNRIDPDRFPLLSYSNRPGAPSKPSPNAYPPFHIGHPGAALQLAPHVVFQDDKAVPPADTAEALRELESQPRVLALADAARSAIAQPGFVAAADAANRGIPNLDAEVVALGTGSALPSKYRNVSATLLRVPGIGSFLLDCGENTLGQLRRAYGLEGADEVVADLRAVWISHLHADHHLGTVSVLRRYRDLCFADPRRSLDPDGRPRRLAVFCHSQFRDFLAEYAAVEPFFGSAVESVAMDAEGPQPAATARYSDTWRGARVVEGAELADRFGLARVESCPVEHCHGAMGVALTLASGLKVAYSGDCRPSGALAAIGRGAHLLVHECTFDDHLVADALAKKHSTLSDALGVARRMNARRLLLTHFSQRYPKIPAMAAAAAAAVEAGARQDEKSPSAGSDSPSSSSSFSYLFAFDYMRVRLGDFAKAEAFLPALQELYEDADAD